MYLSRIQLVLISNYLDKEYAMNLSHGVVHRLKSVWHVIDQTSANFSSPPRSYNLGIEARGCQFEDCVFWGGLARMYLHYGHGLFGNVYLSAGQRQ